VIFRSIDDFLNGYSKVEGRGQNRGSAHNAINAHNAHNAHNAINAINALLFRGEVLVVGQ